MHLKKTVVIKDTLFEEILNYSQIDYRLYELSLQICEDYKDLNPVFISVLNGSFLFSSNLIQKCKIDCEITFVKMKSYVKMSSTGKVVELFGLDTDINGRHVIILEDIVESGLTTNEIIKKIEPLNPKSIFISTLLFKPNKLVYTNLPVKYVGFNILDEFVVGYGLDYDGMGRNLLSIYQLK